MIFSSYIFIFAFLPIVWIGYHTLRHFGAYDSSKVFLVLASLFFYAFWKIEYLPILLGSIIINFLIALAITRGGLHSGFYGNFFGGFSSLSFVRLKECLLCKRFAFASKREREREREREGKIMRVNRMI